ncbi:MAG: hypothetical protein CL943_02360 [Candidatus Diapherotrites archaeon]|uniref:RecF/RecN/SMC N-terminal domain-containing protein n=1 Tax=Candidatus Iainarchaeum sp. TaxID=3101447 RepID=A0A2D6M132_9ARCH|nr:hypothetical protein [Candidatus Diapherotrites archaeon]|tara:strand:+ start:558 stop:3539 length:2982 start_codon:yes stop_codon:yes gene_type:complete
MVKMQKLVLKNFKSFKKAEVPIADGFTVIAGSNGSGKSNILDALLFVLGITSLKTLRASRLTDLVNNSSTENYAKVDLTIKQNGKTYEISRMIDKQGKSIYRIDGNRVTLNETSSLLGELGIRVDGHNIVMQGDVTRVVEMSPEERRQIIDELAGLQEFDKKKEEAMKNLDKVEAKIRETTIVLQERENYLQGLEKERESALLYENLEKEKKQLKATLLSNEIGKIGKQLSENKEKINESKKKKEEIEEKEKELGRRNKVDKEKARELNESILAASEKIFATVGAKLEKKRSEIAVSEERIERKEELVERNKSRVEDSNQKILELEKEKKDMADNRIEIEAKLPGLEKKIGELQKQKNEIEQVYSEKQAGIQGIESRIKELTQQIDLLKQEEITKQVEAERIKNRQRAEKERVQELIKQKEELEAIIDETEKNQGLLESIYNKESDPMDTLKKRRERLENRIRENKRKQALIDSLEEKTAALQKQMAECPVCDSPMGEDKRKQLLTKTTIKIKQESLELLRLSETEEEAKKRIEALEELVFRENELKHLTKNLSDERRKNKELGEQIQSMKSSIGTKSVSGIEADAAKAKEKASGLTAEKERLEQKRNSLIDKLQLDELNQLNNKLNKALHEKSMAEERLGHIQTTLGYRVDKEKKLFENEIEKIKSENSQLGKGLEESKKAKVLMEKNIKELEIKLDKAEEDNKGKIKKRDTMEEEIERVHERVVVLQQKIRSNEQQENQLNIENSGLEVRLTDLNEEFENFKGEKLLKEFEAAESRKRLDLIEKQVASLGAINMKAVESFNELAVEVKEVRTKVEKLEEERIAVLGLIEKIEVKRTTVFMDCFKEVNKHFSETFLDLFEGDGLLSLSNPEIPLESGLIIEAKHKGNSLQNIDSMSGGEKTLTALAFLFAIQLYEPAPFYVFDEADAALDKENSVKMVKIIKAISKKSQFIAITHNDPLIKEADQIIGVALNKQKSSVIGLKLRERAMGQEK